MWQYSGSSAIDTPADPSSRLQEFEEEFTSATTHADIRLDPEESAAAQPAAAAASSSSDQPMEVGQPVVQSRSTTFTPSRPTGMHIPSDSPVVRSPPGLEDQRVTHRLRTKPSFTGPEVEGQGVKRSSDTVPEDLQIQSGAASQERLNAMESVPEEVTHDEM
eukprot:4660132-Amphidinium_carterae.1